MRLTKQYAYALINSIPEEEAIRVWDELNQVNRILEEFPEYVGFIEFEPSEFDVARSVMKEKFHPLVLNFLEVLAEDRMLSQLDTVTEDYRLALIEANLLFDVKVYSANPLSEMNQNQLTKLIESRWGSNYVIDFRVNSKVLGGMKLEVNGAVIDTTFRSRIDQIIREVQHGAKR